MEKLAFEVNGNLLEVPSSTCFMFFIKIWKHFHALFKKIFDLFIEFSKQGIFKKWGFYRTYQIVRKRQFIYIYIYK